MPPCRVHSKPAVRILAAAVCYSPFFLLVVVTCATVQEGSWGREGDPLFHFPGRGRQADRIGEWDLVLPGSDCWARVGTAECLPLLPNCSLPACLPAFWDMEEYIIIISIIIIVLRLLVCVKT